MTKMTTWLKTQPWNKFTNPKFLIAKNQWIYKKEGKIKYFHLQLPKYKKKKKCCILNLQKVGISYFNENSFCESQNNQYSNLKQLDIKLKYFFDYITTNRYYIIIIHLCIFINMVLLSFD